MKWVTYETGHGDQVGVVADGNIHALEPGVALIELMGRGHDGLRTAGEAALALPHEVVPLGEARLRAPIPQPTSMRDCLCYLEHMRNCLRVQGDGTLEDVWYEIPAFYFANHACVVGPYDDVAISPGSGWFDVELEIAAVIGQGGSDLTPAQAQDRIIGYTIYADWSARDLQLLESRLKIGQAKGKDGAVTLGPWLVTPDELEPYLLDGKLALSVEAAVNGEVFGSGRTDSADWSFGEVISYASRGVTLRPGDVFGSGTIPTCCLVEHFSFTNLETFRGWLKDGDVVTLRVDGLGETRQTVRASAPPHPLAKRPNPNATPTRRVNAAPAALPYTKGLHQISAKDWAWVLPDGGYGRSNAGLVTGAGASLLVDTLWDLPMTAEMLDAIRPITDSHPITHAVLTHSNGDHVNGNQLLADSVRILAARGTADEMHHDMPPELLIGLRVADLGPTLTPFVRERFGDFDFTGITVRHPDETFDKERTLDIGGREVRLLNLGPAHTDADTVIHLPDTGVLYAGDLLFIGCTPIVWSGPISHWIAACDTMIGLDAPVVVPGHGPITDPDGIRAVRAYLTHIVEQADAAHHKGLSFQEAAATIDLAEYAAWLDAERVVVNIYQRYRELDPATPAMPQLALMAMMAEWDAAHRPA